jgi:VWFA-related protein
VCLLSLPAANQTAITAKREPAEKLIEDSIVVDVNVVNVFFNVRSGDRLVRDLKASDFQLFENGRPQEIRYFSSDSQEPLSLAIMVDSSTSQSRVLEQQQDIGRRFLQEILLPGDEAMVVGFGSFVQMHQDFTEAQENLLAALARASQGDTERTPLLDPGALPFRRSTALYDAVASTSRRRMGGRRGHKAMIILTDGQDMGSRTTINEAIEAAVRADTICYVLLVADKKVVGNVDYHGREWMKELTSETGGRLIFVGSDLNRLQESLSEVATELRHHYTVAYTSSNKELDGSYRTIRVRTHRGYEVQARRGYYATSPRRRLVPEATP